MEAPPIERMCEFVEGNMGSGTPQYVALFSGEVVGWCDIGRRGYRLAIDRSLGTYRA